MGGGMGGGRGKGGGREQPSAMPGGTRVVVHGLNNAAQHNGKAAQVEDYDASSGRYTVSLEGEGDALRIKFDNLLQACSVEVTGMQNKPELNGKSATICGFDADKGRYHADISGVGRASLKLENLILASGTRARVFGLQSDAGSKWNDKIGKVLSYDRDAGRYLVQMSKEDQLRIKQTNFRV